MHQEYQMFFYYIVDKVCQYFNYSREYFDDPIKRKDKTNPPPPLIKVFQYFEDQWINGKNLNPSDWTCYETKVRTNNTLESWNGQVNREGVVIMYMYMYMYMYM